MKPAESHPEIDFLTGLSGVVVTGASSGIGKQFIKAISSIDPSPVVCNLSRSKPDINFPDERLIHIPCDLTDAKALASAAAEVEAAIRERAPSGRLILLNNSGFGDYGTFPGTGGEAQCGMVDLNVRAMVDLTARLMPLMRERGGWIANVASTAAFQPIPHMATYAATKAFVLNWTVGLDHELRGTGLRALALCPGPTETSFFQRAGFDESPLKRFPGETPEQVVTALLRGMRRNRTIVVSGWRNKLLAGISGITPRNLAAAVAKRIIQRMRMDEKAGQ